MVSNVSSPTEELQTANCVVLLPINYFVIRNASRLGQWLA